jgi:hypothetical protein
MRIGRPIHRRKLATIEASAACQSGLRTGGVGCLAIVTDSTL